MLTRLTQEFGQLQAMQGDLQNPQGWNQLVIPFQLSQQQIEPVNLFWKRNRSDAASFGEGDGEHFLIDLTLSAWGHLQLDGLVKKEQPLGFDLVIRTEMALGGAVERDIAAIYREASEISGFKGSLLFRHGLGACVPLPIAAKGGVAADHSIIV